MSSLKKDAEIQTPYGKATVTKPANTQGTAHIRYDSGDSGKIHTSEQWTLIQPGK
jgi:hypothetical protein